MVGKSESDKYSDEETVRRREGTLKKMLNTPPSRHAPLRKKKRAAKVKTKRTKLAKS